jgi:hypothetical protein
LGNISKATDLFYKALEIARDPQMISLNLIALVGIGCVLRIEGENDFAWSIYNFVRLHPKTPVLYLEMASRWFQDFETQINRKTRLLKGKSLLKRLSTRRWG